MPNLPVPILAQEVPGNFWTAALYTQNVYNAITFLLNPPLYTGTQSTVQSIPTGTWTWVAIDTTQRDTYGGHSNVTNNSRYVAQVAGTYTVAGVVAYAANPNGGREAAIAVNGSRVTGTAGLIPPTSSIGASVATACRDVVLNAGDYVELQAIQDSGGALNTQVGAELACALWVRWTHV